MEDLSKLTTSQLRYEKLILHHIKHKASNRRITSIERQIGLIKKELNKRYKESLKKRFNDNN